MTAVLVLVMFQDLLHSPPLDQPLHESEVLSLHLLLSTVPGTQEAHTNKSLCDPCLGLAVHLLPASHETGQCLTPANT